MATSGYTHTLSLLVNFTSRIFHYTDLNSIYSQLGCYNNIEIGYTLFMMSIAAPHSTNAFTASISPCVAASWRAVSPYCSNSSFSVYTTPVLLLMCMCSVPTINIAWLYLVFGVHCCSMLHQQVDYFHFTPHGSLMEGSVTIL